MRSARASPTGALRLNGGEISERKNFPLTKSLGANLRPQRMSWYQPSPPSTWYPTVAEFPSGRRCPNALQGGKQLTKSFALLRQKPHRDVTPGRAKAIFPRRV